MKDPLDYTLGNKTIPESNCCKYLGIIISSDLSWADDVNYTVKKAWKALHFIMRILKKGNIVLKPSLQDTSTPDSRVCSFVLGSVQRRTDSCVRSGAKQSG